MYINYHIINDNEVIAITSEGETVKITGSNKKNIEKLILLSNKVEGLDNKTNYLNNTMTIIHNKIKKLRIKKFYTFILSLLLGTASILGLIISSPTTFIILFALGSLINLSTTINDIKKIEKYNHTYNLFMTEWGTTFNEMINIREEFQDLSSSLEIEKQKNKVKEDLIRAYKTSTTTTINLPNNYENINEEYTLKLIKNKR